MMTIYGILLKDNLVTDNSKGTLLKEIVGTFLNDSVRDAQGLFDRLCELNAWTTPAEEEDACCVAWDSETYQVTLNDGAPAGLLVTRVDDIILLDVYQLPETVQWRNRKRVHDKNEEVILQAKKLVIRRIAELLKESFDGDLKFAPGSQIRLDKYDMDLDMETPCWFGLESLKVEDEKDEDHKVVLAYKEVEDREHIWTDSLDDLSLCDVQSILYKVEDELSR